MPYIGIGPEQGRVVDESEAYSYALDRCLHGTVREQIEFRAMLTEWYFSGNWLRED